MANELIQNEVFHYVELRHGKVFIDTMWEVGQAIRHCQYIEMAYEHFHVPYRNRFEEGEFRKRIPVMCGGELRKVRFVYSGSDIEAILDRLPTAKVLAEKDGKHMIEAEVFGKGIDTWLRGQGEGVSCQ